MVTVSASLYSFTESIDPIHTSTSLHRVWQVDPGHLPEGVTSHHEENNRDAGHHEQEEQCMLQRHGSRGVPCRADGRGRAARGIGKAKHA